MDKHQRLVCAIALVAVALTGCSSSRQLENSDQAKSFITNVAQGGTIDQWRLASGAGATAVRAWGNRIAIRDLGRRLKEKGSTWACEFAEVAAQYEKVGIFNFYDRKVVVDAARHFGAGRGEIDAMLHDVTSLTAPELEEVAAEICD